MCMYTCSLIQWYIRYQTCLCGLMVMVFKSGCMLDTVASLGSRIWCRVVKQQPHWPYIQDFELSTKNMKLTPQACLRNRILHVYTFWFVPRMH